MCQHGIQHECRANEFSAADLQNNCALYDRALNFRHIFYTPQGSILDVEPHQGQHSVYLACRVDRYSGAEVIHT